MCVCACVRACVRVCVCVCVLTQALNYETERHIKIIYDDDDDDDGDDDDCYNFSIIIVVVQCREKSGANILARGNCTLVVVRSVVRLLSTCFVF